MFDLLPPVLVAAILNRTSDNQDDHADGETVQSLGATCTQVRDTLRGIRDVVLVENPRQDRRRFVESLREGGWRVTLDANALLNGDVLRYMATVDVPPILERAVSPVESLVDLHSELQPTFFTVWGDDDGWYTARSGAATAHPWGHHSLRVPAWRGLAVGSLLIHGADRLQWVQVRVGGVLVVRVHGVALRAFTRGGGDLELMGLLRHLAIVEWHSIRLEANDDLNEVSIRLRNSNNGEPFVWSFYQVGEEYCHRIDDSETCAIRVYWNMVGVGILCAIQDEEGVWRTDCVATLALESSWPELHALTYELPGWAAVVRPSSEAGTRFAGSRKGRSSVNVVEGLPIHCSPCYYMPVDDAVNFSRCDDIKIRIKWKKVPRGGTVRVVAITRNWIRCQGGMLNVRFAT